MTYQELLDQLKKATPKQLKQDAVICISFDEDEFCEIQSLEPIGNSMIDEDTGECIDESVEIGQLCFTIECSPDIGD